jgi:hypothetical protein
VNGAGNWQWSGYVTTGLQDFDGSHESNEKMGSKKKQVIQFAAGTERQTSIVNSAILCSVPQSLIDSAAYFGPNGQCLQVAPKSDLRDFICYKP